MIFARLQLIVPQLAVGLTALLVTGVSLAADEPIDYASQIKPVLRARCYACHGVLKQESGLRLDTVGAALAGGESGAAVVPRDDNSLLLQRVAAPEDERMPPEGEPLTAQQIAWIRQWIEQGAVGPADEAPENDPRAHWSFQPPRRPAPPQVARRAWVRNPIDAFLAAGLEQQGLSPQAPADRRTLLRRVYLDLIGLPPTVQEQEDFLADASPQAYELVVDRLLDSPHYGERWGRHLMDVWRYSDWWGLGAEVRNSQKHMWHWRDWIMESLNADKGYDQMIREMLAADELYPNDLDRLRATGYLARQYFKFNRTTWLDETVEHTFKAFVGLTFNCAKCHDHKYDPLSQKEYYQLRAFFEPYQIRMEMAPGTADFEADGIPRAFDCNLDAPTYLHIRGDDRNPDTSAILSPAVPAFLAFENPPIETVTLPPQAYQPGLRSYVHDNLLRDAQAAVEAARAKVAAAGVQLAAAQSRAVLAQTAASTSAAGGASADSPESRRILVEDDFAHERPERWEMLAGQWSYEHDQLRQTAEGPQPAVLRLRMAPPQDFEARLTFTTLGGQMWKSVGVAFDVEGDTHEVLVYTSAFSGGPKLQIAHKDGAADYQYPATGAIARDIQLNAAYELTLRVRGNVVNILIDGSDALAYRLPVARRAGSLQLITFDAQAAFAHFSLEALPDSALLREPSSADANAPLTVEQASAAVAVAERQAEAAGAAVTALARRREADQFQLGSSDSPPAQAARRDAAAAEKQVLIHQAEAALAQAQLELLRADEAARAAAAKKRGEAQAALEKVRQEAEQTDEQYTPLPGALKTLESNQETEASRRRPFPRNSSGRRTALAQWLSSSRNPLTARVIVNHLWARHMGRPLVATVFDLGRKGAPPTHPQLLDWLAMECMDHHWSLKHLHRLMVTSSAYRMSSSNRWSGSDPPPEDESAAPGRRDPENRWYWRMHPMRMEAQLVRDSLLHLAGDLDAALGGPSIPVSDAASRRRSLYFFHSNNEQQRFLEMFDDAKVQECYRRSESVVPQQALALENSALAQQAAEKVAARIQDRLGAAGNDLAFIQGAFITVLADEPNAAERETCLEALQQLREVCQDSADPDRQARMLLVQALFNHNDFVTVR